MYLPALRHNTTCKLFDQVDRITVPGVALESEDGESIMPQPMTIFTFDICDPFHGLFEPQHQLNEYGMKQQLPVEWGSASMQSQVRRLRKSVDSRFYNYYSKGINAYVNGDWQTAEQAFRASLGWKPADGPTNQILSYMRSLEMKPPSTWKTLYHEFKEGY